MQVRQCPYYRFLSFSNEKEAKIVCKETIEGVTT